MSSTIPPEPANEGFTLIEVLVALSIVALALASLGALTASTVRGARSIEARFTRLEIARAVLTALPERDRFPANLSGEIAGYRWRIQALPFDTGIASQRRVSWLAEEIVLTLRSPGGDAMQFSTVRLHQRNGG